MHFWTSFIGANVTFGPMHFLGLAGMPRRIPDFPEAFAGWNAIASYGSYINLFSTFFFFGIVAQAFTNAQKEQSGQSQKNLLLSDKPLVH
jgi:heme/copper-type cytochrome/quinol oxidase subunit 1